VCPNKDKWVKQVSKKSLKCAPKKRWPKKLQRNPSFVPKLKEVYKKVSK
jgi:hypothetical protein